MKLRLETGNFGIKATWDADTNTYKYAPMPKGLTYIDFAGSIIEGDNIATYTVMNAIVDEDYPHVIDLEYLMGKPVPVYYNSLNGKVSENVHDVLDDNSSSDEGGSDDSGSGGDIAQ